MNLIQITFNNINAKIKKYLIFALLIRGKLSN